MAFEGSRLVARGPLAEVVTKAKDLVDRGERDSVLILRDRDGTVLDVDYRGTPWQVLDRLAMREVPGSNPVEPPAAPSPPAGPRPRGRPRLGVVAREVTLLPRHWEWLNSQPGGASVALRRLVEDARRANADLDAARLAREATYRFMLAMAGSEPGFEDAARALFAGERQAFSSALGAWPKDVAGQAARLAEPSFAAA